MQGSKQKDWAEALRRAVHRESDGRGSPRWLDVIANRVCEAAAEGDAQAFKEIGDRLDGKPKQQTEVSGPDGDPLPLSISIGFKSAD
jgi:hypothetical protein